LRRKLPSNLLSYVEESINLIDKTIEQIRDISLDLRPSILDNLGLKSALRWYVEKQKERSNIEIKYDFEFDEKRFSSDYAITIFRIVQESLTNIIRHSNANRVLLEIKEKDKEMIIQILDDGVGIEVEEIWKRVKEGKALGILGIKERVELLKGNLNIESEKGKGTHIKIVLPLE